MIFARNRVAFLIAAGSLSLAAYAQTHTPAPSDTSAAAGSAQPPVGGVSRDLQKEFKDLDRDGDGYLSRAEIEQSSKLKEKFDSADKNGDGKLDQSEFQVLEAEASPDRSLGSASPVEKGAAGASR